MFRIVLDIDLKKSWQVFNRNGYVVKGCLISFGGFGIMFMYHKKEKYNGTKK